MSENNTDSEKQKPVKAHKNSANVKCRWAIGLLFAEGTKFVTRLDKYPGKHFYWDSCEKPLYFESKRTADDYAFGMAVNGYPAVVIEVPDGFTLKNPDKEVNDHKT